jgi:hypothetical protein
MLKGRGRDTRQVTSPAPVQLANRPAVVPSSTRLTLRTPLPKRAPIAKPEPDYEVVEFPSEQYVNAKLQPPPPPPPRPPTGNFTKFFLYFFFYLLHKLIYRTFNQRLTQFKISL